VFVRLKGRGFVGGPAGRPAQTRDTISGEDAVDVQERFDGAVDFGHPKDMGGVKPAAKIGRRFKVSHRKVWLGT
jgi:hypothetical protein